MAYRQSQYLLLTVLFYTRTLFYSGNYYSLSMPADSYPISLLINIRISIVLWPSKFTRLFLTKMDMNNSDVKTLLISVDKKMVWYYLKGFFLDFGQKIIVPLRHKLSKYGNCMYAIYTYLNKVSFLLCKENFLHSINYIP